MEAQQVKARRARDRAVLTGSSGIPHADQGVQRSFHHVLGIDLGGGKGKKTALATLRVDGATATVVDIAPRTGRRAVLRPDAARDHPRLRRRDAAVHRRAADVAALPALHGAGLPRAGRVRRSVGGRDAGARRRSRRGARRRATFGRAATATRAGASRRSRRTRSARPRSTWRAASASPRARASAREPVRSPRAPRTSCARSPIVSRSTRT